LLPFWPAVTFRPLSPRIFCSLPSFFSSSPLGCDFFGSPPVALEHLYRVPFGIEPGPYPFLAIVPHGSDQSVLPVLRGFCEPSFETQPQCYCLCCASYHFPPPFFGKGSQRAFCTWDFLYYMDHPPVPPSLPVFYSPRTRRASFSV